MYLSSFLFIITFIYFKKKLAPTNLFKQNILQRHDMHVFMVIPLIFLAFGSIFA
jgi:hypothetical protein